MFGIGNKNKIIQDLHAEINRITKESANEVKRFSEEKKELEESIAKLTGTYKELAVVLDTNILLRLAQLRETRLLEKFEGQVFIPRVVNYEMEGLKSQAITYRRAVHKAIDNDRIPALNYLKRHSARRRQEMMRRNKGPTKRAINEAIQERNIPELAHLLKMSQEDRYILEKRMDVIMAVWKQFAEKTESGKWRLAGSNGDLYFRVFDAPFDMESGETIGERIKESDVRIIAACLNLKENKGFKQVILVTRDKDLGRSAKSFDIQVETIHKVIR